MRWFHLIFDKKWLSLSLSLLNLQIKIRKRSTMGNQIYRGHNTHYKCDARTIVTIDVYLFVVKRKWLHAKIWLSKVVERSWIHIKLNINRNNLKSQIWSIDFPTNIGNLQSTRWTGKTENSQILRNERWNLCLVPLPLFSPYVTPSTNLLVTAQFPHPILRQPSSVWIVYFRSRWYWYFKILMFVLSIGHHCKSACASRLVVFLAQVEHFIQELSGMNELQNKNSSQFIWQWNKSFAINFNNLCYL